MAKEISEIQTEIQELEPLQQRELLGFLVAEPEGSDNGDLDELWLQEAQRRFQELKEDSVKGISATQVFAKLESRLG